MSDYLTAALPGIGGQVKQEPADFYVEEIPLYQACGKGEHLYLEIEKLGLTTFDLVRDISQQTGVRERDIGYAGMKDARATTRQTISVPGLDPDRAEALNQPGIRILSATRHGNKLRLGHLAGNRFRIRVRSPRPESAEDARQILDVLEDLGVPNRFGEQRYGVLNNSHLIGHALLQRDYQAAAREIIGDPEKIQLPAWQQAARHYAAREIHQALEFMPGHHRDERRLLHCLADGGSVRKAVLGLRRKLLRLYLSAYQSSLFDRIVSMRLATMEKLWPGDLAYKHANGACFEVQNAETEQPRADRFEISPSGPLFGYKVTLAKGQAGLLEQSLLDKEGLQLEDFRLNSGLKMEGERRPLRVPLTDAAVIAEGGDLILTFSLPRGSYATSVLREIIKSPGEQAETD